MRFQNASQEAKSRGSGLCFGSACVRTQPLKGVLGVGVGVLVVVVVVVAAVGRGATQRERESARGLAPGTMA